MGKKRRQSGKALEDLYRQALLMEGPGAIFEDGEEAKAIVKLLKLPGPEEKALRQAISLLKIREAASRIDNMPTEMLRVIEREAAAILREQGLDDLYLRTGGRPKDEPPGANRLTGIAAQILENCRRMRSAFETMAGRTEVVKDASPDVREFYGSEVMPKGIKLGLAIRAIDIELCRDDVLKAVEVMEEADRKAEARRQGLIAKFGDPIENRRIALEEYDRLKADDPNVQEKVAQKRAADKAGISPRQVRTYLKDRK